MWIQFCFFYFHGALFYYGCLSVCVSTNSMIRPLWDVLGIYDNPAYKQWPQLRAGLAALFVGLLLSILQWDGMDSFNSTETVSVSVEMFTNGTTSVWKD